MKPGAPRKIVGLALFAVVVLGVLGGVYIANRSSSGRGRIEVPNLSGLTAAEAREVLVRSELTLGLVGRRGPDSEHLLVAEQTPRPGSEVAERVAVDVIVSPAGDDYSSASTNWEFTPSSRQEIPEILARFDFGEAALLDIPSPPRRLLVWESAGHFHARTDYGPRESGVSLIQSDEESSLQGGDFIEFRGAEVAFRQGRTISWIERGYALSLTPGDRTYGRSLEWVRP